MGFKITRFSVIPTANGVEAKILNESRVEICSNCGGTFRVKVAGQTRCSECQTTKALRNKIRKLSGL